MHASPSCELLISTYPHPKGLKKENKTQNFRCDLTKKKKGFLKLKPFRKQITIPTSPIEVKKFDWFDCRVCHWKRA